MLQKINQTKSIVKNAALKVRDNKDVIAALAAVTITTVAINVAVSVATDKVLDKILTD